MFPIEAFDLYQGGERIKPWALVDLLLSVVFFTQYPVEHAENPDGSFLDIHRLMEENLLFILNIKMNISRNFHDPETPKFPLVIESELMHISNSSKRTYYIVRHKDCSLPYITCTSDDVMVDKLSRRPKSFPSWWQQKYSYLRKQKEKVMKPTSNSRYLSSWSDIRVEYEHIDHNLHAASSVYLKLCINAIFRTVVNEDRRGYLTSAHLHAGVKCIQMFFHRESNYGDSLTVEIHENCLNINEVFFEIKKRAPQQEYGIECCSVAVEFYEPTQ